MKKNVRKKDPNSTNSTGVLLLYHPCAQTSGIIIYSDGRTNGKMNSKSRIEIEQMLLGRDLRNQYKIPKNSILARNFSLSQGNKDKSCSGQEIRETVPVLHKTLYIWLFAIQTRPQHTTADHAHYHETILSFRLWHSSPHTHDRPDHLDHSWHPN